ncbi:hypothetical protein F4821DRAFT_274532 [Hypoxylon rubiginosum]|uniref:Uncharacterized protein n=1 Tax=Hypoxylon rubiginosum TaxID=110542 RepID=A0ACC0CNG4_9PEZI|nr:hypothetical protein F4821DRAFT_274532 [Hypoxylon rubiginosum]
MADSDDLGPSFRIYVIFMIVLTVASLALRFLSRSLLPSSRQTPRYRWDDWIALGAGVLISAQLAIELAMIPFGFGRHIWTLQPGDLPKFLKLLFASYIVFHFAIALPKVSALLFYSRVFPRHVNSTLFNSALWITHAANVAWVLGCTIGTILACEPLAEGRNESLYGVCEPDTPYWTGSAVSSVIVDFAVLVIPLPKIWTLQTSMGRKTGLTVIFVLGYSVIVVSLGRTITGIISKDALGSDPTYLTIRVFYWASAEVPISILSICLPAMLPLARHINRKYLEPLTTRIASYTSRFRQDWTGDTTYRLESITTDYEPTDSAVTHDSRDELINR